MAIYNRSWLHTIAHDLQAPDVDGNLWQSICKHYGITQTKNGTWLEALCDFFNVNKADGEAWIQALALDFGANDQISTFTVTFQYQRFTVSNNPLGSIINVGGIFNR